MAKRRRGRPRAAARRPAPAAAPPRASRRDWGRREWTNLGWALLPPLLAVAVYFEAIGNPFVYDDLETVVRNPSLRDLSNWVFVLVFSPFRPVVNVSYAVDAAIWGLDPFGFHLTGVLLHALNVALFYLFARALLRDRDAMVENDASPAPRADRLAALTAAALFAVHPLMSEAVGYTSARPELLCSAFVFTALLCARRAVLERRWVFWIAAAVAWLLALGSRETGAMVPLAFLAWDRLLGPRDGPRDDEARRRRLWRLHLPLLVLVLAGGVARILVFLQREVGALPRQVWQHLCTELPILWRYLRLLLWPAGQSLVHPAQRVASPWEAKVLLAAVAILVVATLAWRLRRRLPLLAFGLVWFGLFLAPSSTLIPLVELMAEHRVYLASCGIFLVAGAGAGRLAGWWRERDRQPRLAAHALVAIVVAALGVATMARNQVWADPVTLWSDAAAKAPLTWAPHYALGDALRGRGDCTAAIAAYQRAVELRPDDPRARVNLGVCLGTVGRHVEAEQALRAALAVDPGSVDARNDLGWLANLQRRPDLAARWFREALEHDPNDVTAHMNLAVLAERVFHDPDSAREHCEAVERVQPGIPVVRECLRRLSQPTAPGPR